MRKKLLKTILAVAAVACLVSCGGNGGNNAPEFRWNGDIIGAVKRYGENQNIDIIMDNLDTVRTVNTKDLDPKTFSDGTRVISFVYMNQRTKVGNHFIFNTLVDNIAPMPVKKVLDLSYVNADPERVDSVGNDPIIIKDEYGAVVSGNFIDIRYYYLYDSKESKKHNITFVADDENSNDSKLYLAMRHRSDNDEGADVFNGVLSCDIKKYLDNAKDGKLTIELIYNDGIIDQKRVLNWTRPE